MSEGENLPIPPPETPAAEAVPPEPSAALEQQPEPEARAAEPSAEPVSLPAGRAIALDAGPGEPPEPEPAPKAEAAAPAPVPEAPRAPLPELPPKRSARLGALALLKLDKVDDDDTFRLRPEGEIDSLATSLAKLGQLFPVDLRLRPPDRFQIVTGFRRVAALRLLKRERVLARVHTDLSEEDGLGLALADLLEHKGADHDELVAVRGRLEEQGRLTPGLAGTLDRAINPPEDQLAPEMVEGEGEEEVDLDELAQDLIGRLASVNQDLALVAELWSAMDPGLKQTLLEQLGYPEQLVGYLRRL